MLGGVQELEVMFHVKHYLVIRNGTLQLIVFDGSVAWICRGGATSELSAQQ